MSKFVDQENLLKNIKSFFGHPKVALKEAIQNARRAGAENVEIVFNDEAKNIRVKNDGEKIRNFKNFLIISGTGWEEESIKKETPAGWGVLSILSVVETLIVKNLQNPEKEKLIIISDKFFNDEAYREELYRVCEEIKIEGDGAGVELELIFKGEKNYSSLVQDIFILKGYSFSNFIEMNLKFRRGSEELFFKNRSELLRKEREFYPGVWSIGNEERLSYILPEVIFNGEVMLPEVRSSSASGIKFYIKDNSNFMPILPYRSHFYCSEEKKAEILKSFNRYIAIKMIETIKTAEEYYKKILISTLVNNTEFLEEKELNFLDIFPFRVMNLNEGRKVERFFSKKELPVFENSEINYGSNLIFGGEHFTFLTMETNKAFPEWVNDYIEKIKTKKIEKIDLSEFEFEEVGAENFAVRFISKETLDLKNKVIVFKEFECENSNAYYEFLVFCNPEDRHVLSEALHSYVVFDYVYCDGTDCDSYDTQKHYFDSEVDGFMNEVYPSDMGIMETINYHKIYENNIKNIKNDKHFIEVEYFEKTKGKFKEILSKKRKSILKMKF